MREEMENPDLTITPDEIGFERDSYHRQRKHEEVEVQVEFDAHGHDLTSLMESSDGRAAEIAQGREHYIWRILAEEEGDGLRAECCMYVMVPRVTSRAAQQPENSQRNPQEHQSVPK